MEISTIVTIGLFLAVQLITFFKYVKDRDTKFDNFITRMEDRTNLLSEDLRRVNRTLEGLIDTKFRLDVLVKAMDDHEVRIRLLEKVRLMEK